MAEESRLMTSGIGSWTDISGKALVVVNSPVDGNDDVAGVLGAVNTAVAGQLCLIAPAAWRSRLADLGLGAADVLFSEDAAGGPLELNYFLEQFDTLHWIIARRPDLIVGTSPHSLYNDEIKDVFEQRVALVLGEAKLLAHAWPAPFVYFLSLGDVVLRFDRRRKMREYVDSAQAVVHALHRDWIKSGRPEQVDSPPEFDSVLASQLGPLMTFDEDHGSPVDAVSLSVVADFVAYVERVLHPAVALRDDRITGLETTAECLRRDLDEKIAEIQRLNGVVAVLIQRLDETIAERKEAVSIRDASIEHLHNELYRVTRSWRKLIVGRPKL
jgi:hypothetical protein